MEQTTCKEAANIMSAQTKGIDKIFNDLQKYLPRDTSPRRGEGLRQKNTCRKVPLKIKFFG
jgi:hypothetical protein